MQQVSTFAANKRTNMRLYALILAFGLSLLTFACQSESANASDTTDSNSEVSTDNNQTTTSGLHIVYINSDSLQSGYTALRTELEALEDNYNTAEANHESRVRSLQREVESLQNQVQRGELSQNRIAQEQERIARREQEIMQQHGGRISARLPEGGGLAIKLELPA